MTISDRVTRLETENKIVINHIQSDLKEVKTNVKKISLEMPELIRRVGKLHEVFNNHVKIIEGLKNGDCPASKPTRKERAKDEDGNLKERRTKKSWIRQFREMPLYKKISIIIIASPFVAKYWEWIFEKLIALLTWFKAIPQ